LEIYDNQLVAAESGSPMSKTYKIFYKLLIFVLNH
jgi:hypothetical protein